MKKLTVGNVTVPKDWMLTTDKELLANGLSAYHSAMSCLYDAIADHDEERIHHLYALSLSNFSRCFAYLSGFKIKNIPEEINSVDKNPFSSLEVGEMKTLCEQFDAVLSTYIAPASKAVVRQKPTTKKGTRNAKKTRN
jgi:hypothetical protein